MPGANRCSSDRHLPGATYTRQVTIQRTCLQALAARQGGKALSPCAIASCAGSGSRGLQWRSLGCEFFALVEHANRAMLDQAKKLDLAASATFTP